MAHPRDRELPGIARYLSDLSDDSGQASLPHSSDSESDFVEPEQAGPSKIDRRALFFCEVCEIECSSVEVLQDHFAGIKHKKKLGLSGLSSNLKTKYDIKFEDELSGKVVECTLCKVIFHGLEQAFHFKSEKHRALCNFATESKVDNRQWLRVICDAPERSPEDEMMNMDEPEKVADGYHCNLCSATMPTMTLFQAHIEGKRHQKKARWQYLCIEGDMSEVNQYWCRLCNMFCTDRDALTAHYRGRNHIKLLQKKNIIQVDDPQAVDKSSDIPRKKGSSSSQSRGNACIKRESVDDVKLSSRYGSKGHHYRDSRSESSERSYSPPSRAPIRSPSPAQSLSPPSKRRIRSPWSYNRKFSHRSPSEDHSPEREGRSSKQNFHHSSRRQSRQSRSRSHERHRSPHRDIFKSRGRRDSNFQQRRNSSSSHSQSRRHMSDSDNTQESQSSSLSRGQNMHKSYRQHQRIHSSSDSQSYSSSRSRHRHHSYNRSRSHSRDGDQSRGKSRGQTRDGHHKTYGRRDSKRHMERRSSRPHVKTEPQSEEDELDRFKGFSRSKSSDESSGDAPPISSLTVSHILHAVRKECRKYK